MFKVTKLPRMIAPMGLKVIWQKLMGKNVEYNHIAKRLNQPWNYQQHLTDIGGYWQTCKKIIFVREPDFGKKMSG